MSQATLKDAGAGASSSSANGSARQSKWTSGGYEGFDDSVDRYVGDGEANWGVGNCWEHLAEGTCVRNHPDWGRHHRHS